jgi:hypothetical protein
LPTPVGPRSDPNRVRRHLPRGRPMRTAATARHGSSFSDRAIGARPRPPPSPSAAHLVFNSTGHLARASVAVHLRTDALQPRASLALRLRRDGRRHRRRHQRWQPGDGQRLDGEDEDFVDCMDMSAFSKVGLTSLMQLTLAKNQFF